MSKNEEKNSKMVNQYFLEEPFVFLLNPTLIKYEITMLQTMQVNKILPEFVKRMKNENEFIDFKVLGQITANSVKIHKNKIDLVIKHQLRLDIKAEKKKTESEFDLNNQLPYWYSRPRMILASNLQKWQFYEELLITFQELEQALDPKEQKKRLNPNKESEIEGPKNRRKKLTADALSHFDYLMNFDLVDVEKLVNSIWNLILELSLIINPSLDSSPANEHEIMFDLLFVERLRVISETELDFNQERIQLEKVRTLMSLLYLIQEGKIEAWQDEDSLEIGIKLLRLPD